MLLKYLRLFSQVGTDALKDISLASSIKIDFDKLYLAQHYPFVNLFMLMKVINAPLAASVVSSVLTPYDNAGPTVYERVQLSFPVTPTNGTFTLTIDGLTTAPIAWNADTIALEAAIRAVAGFADVEVTPDAAGPIIEFINVEASPVIVTTSTMARVLNTKLKIEYWDSLGWREAVDVMDSGAGLKSTGMIQFSLRNNYGWGRISQTDDDSTSLPDELKGLYVNDCYWARISFVGDAPNPLTEIEKICYAFTTTEQINSEDVEGANYYESIKEDKTDWVNEIIHASEQMVSDLKRVGFIKSAGQIIELDEIYQACTYKTLMHIYFQLGKAYVERRAIMANKYEKALSSKALTFDKNADGKIDRAEINATSTGMMR